MGLEWHLKLQKLNDYATGRGRIHQPSRTSQLPANPSRDCHYGHSRKAIIAIPNPLLLLFM